MRTALELRSRLDFLWFDKLKAVYYFCGVTPDKHLARVRCTAQRLRCNPKIAPICL